MHEPRIVVLDSSIGVKWIKPESGRAEALDLLAEHRDGRARIVVAAHFLSEVVAVAVRHGGAEFGARTWDNLRLAQLTVVSMDDALVAEALEHVRSLGIAFYDALPAGLATMTGATLYSGDARAHAGVPGAVILGGSDS